MSIAEDLNLHNYVSTFRRFVSGCSSLFVFGSPSAARFSFFSSVDVAGGWAGEGAALLFFLTTTPFRDFLISFLNGTGFSEGVFGAGAGAETVNNEGGGLFVA